MQPRGLARDRSEGCESRGRGASSASSGSSGWSRSPSTSTTDRSPPTSRPGTTSPRNKPRSSRFEPGRPTSRSVSRARRASRRRSERHDASASFARESSSSSSRESRTGERLSVVSGGVDDRAILERQLGRAPRAFRRVVVRCPYGLPAVTEQSPYDGSDEPFPTTYYLTCPALVASVSRLESAGGVERWSDALARDCELASSLARATEDQRKLRHELAGARRGSDRGASLDLGIAGSRKPGHLK